MQYLATFTASTLFALGMALYAAATVLQSFRQAFGQADNGATEAGAIATMATAALVLLAALIPSRIVSAVLFIIALAPTIMSARMYAPYWLWVGLIAACAVWAIVLGRDAIAALGAPED